MYIVQPSRNGQPYPVCLSVRSLRETATSVNPFLRISFIIPDEGKKCNPFFIPAPPRHCTALTPSGIMAFKRKRKRLAPRQGLPKCKGRCHANSVTEGLYGGISISSPRGSGEPRKNQDSPSRIRRTWAMDRSSRLAMAARSSYSYLLRQTPQPRDSFRETSPNRVHSRTASRLST